ncbi:N-acetyllactosaminide beta-1,6-N-acetylglucosaminyl-transferase-like [Saccoglossus kowalevskii]|uniref:N-acetyllactosaminide beta-1,6-N-acetylglucosaminyl-transferase, isoform A-like n=1 Tax=Saccoglossus kowalevskii TaxID=10224 RepID=A0ABM0GKZ0_SACKO|nr:PREDICTED: N-acetyllactosaminide beta-1,6-N-acetylglucosaminyl-transferase, isoform A-like [Saccoglossus kowalevskii]
MSSIEFQKATKYRNDLKLLCIVVLLVTGVQFWYIKDTIQTWTPGKLINDYAFRDADNAILLLQDKRRKAGVQLTCSNTTPLNRSRINAILTSKRNELYSKYHWIPDLNYLEITKECASFRENEGFYSKPLSKMEASFPIAYSILMYKSVQQVTQLMRMIYMPQNVYCIHVDAKSPWETHKAMKSVARCFDNVFLASQLEMVTHCSISVLQAEMNCMRDLINSEYKWKYFINLCGQDFPLKTNYEIVQVLKTLKGKNDVHSIRNSDPSRHLYSHTINNNIISPIYPSKFKEAPPSNITVYKGEFHVLLTREFVNFTLNDKLAKEFFSWLSDTKCPDEHFFSSLNRLAGVAGGYPGDTKTIISRSKLWESNFRNTACHGRSVRSICVFSLGDLPRLVQQPQLFVNKFDRRFDSLVIDCQEELLRHRTKHPVRFDPSYYNKLPHVKGAT